MKEEVRAKILEDERNSIQAGKLVDLVPLKPEYFSYVAELRNRNRNRYFLHQEFELTESMQKHWYQKYLARKDDIYWIIRKKNGDCIGTIRLYDINLQGDSCEQGSFILDENHAKEAPYAVETELLSLDFGFYSLAMQQIENNDRKDNKMMNNLSRRVGFQFEHVMDIRGVEYNHYVLMKERYDAGREMMQDLIQFWCQR